MNYIAINDYATELVNSFVSLESDTKWDLLLKTQEDLIKTPLENLISTPEYITVIFAGHIHFNDAAYIAKLRDSIEWPEDQLEDHLAMMSERRVAGIAKSRLQKWQEIKKEYPSHAAMVIFVVHSLFHNPDTANFLNNLKQ